MTTPRALALGAVIGFYLIELWFIPAVQLATVAALYGFLGGLFGYTVTSLGYAVSADLRNRP